MRKLKLQMQMSVDGYVAGPNGELDWMTWEWDKELENYVSNLTESIDTILLGRKMTDEFINYWTKVTANPADREYYFARKMVDTPKVVFSRTLKKSEWANTELAEGDSVNYINQLKEKPGKDIIVYGGAGFVSSLIKDNLIDEYHLFTNPAAIGNGMKIFSNIGDKFKMKIKESKAFDCGVVHNYYEPAENIGKEK